MATRGTPSVDRARVWWMAYWDFPASIIAERLGCSARHVRRLVAEMEGVDLDEVNPIWGTPREKEMWAHMADVVGYGAGHLAVCVGRSPQAVYQWLQSRPANDALDWEGTPVHIPAHQTDDTRDV